MSRSFVRVLVDDPSGWKSVMVPVAELLKRRVPGYADPDQASYEVSSLPPGDAVAWIDIVGKPGTFAPSVHDILTSHNFPGGTDFLRGDGVFAPAGGSTPVATTATQGKAKVDHNSAGDPIALTSTGHGSAADPHTQYALDTDKGAPNGIATLDSGTKVPVAQLPVSTTAAKGVARVDHNSAGDPVALTQSGHESAADPHPQYALDTEKGAANGLATLDSGGKVPSGQVPFGSSATTACVGNDSRLSDPRSPTAHHATHEIGGSDTLQVGTSSRVVGRKTAAAGAIELLTASEILDFIAGVADGDVLYRTGGAWTRLAKGTAYQQLRMNAGATAPEWAANGEDLASANTADVVANAADQYLLGLTMAGRMKAGTFLRLVGRVTKTGAGIAAPAWNVRVGTNGSTGDTARVTLNSGAQTGVIDDGWFQLDVAIRTYSATGVVAASLLLVHSLATTGLNNAATVKTYSGNSAAFDLTPASTKIGVSVNPGASGVWTFQTLGISAHNLV